MREINVKVKKLRPEAQLPLMATIGSAGSDIRACLYDEETGEKVTKIVIPAYGKAKINTGLQIINMTNTKLIELILLNSMFPIKMINRSIFSNNNEIIFYFENITENKIIINNNDIIGQFITIPLNNEVCYEN